MLRFPREEPHVRKDHAVGGTFLNADGPPRWEKIRSKEKRQNQQISSVILLRRRYFERSGKTPHLNRTVSLIFSIWRNVPHPAPQQFVK